MKNSNIIKNNTLYKFFILTILIIIPVAILYFNFENQILFNNNIIKENLVNNNLINICNSKQAHFYDLDVAAGTNPDSLHVSQTSDAFFVHNSKDCQHECEKKTNCNFYIERSNNCVLYDLSKPEFSKIKVNCSNKQIPHTDGIYNISDAISSTNIYSGIPFSRSIPPSEVEKMRDRNNINNGYLGEGKVKRDFYNDHLDKFDHIDFNLNEANNIKNRYNKILRDINYHPGPDLDQTNAINSEYEKVNIDISNLAAYLDLSRNYLYSSVIQYPKRDSDPTTIYTPNYNPYGLFDNENNARNINLDGLDVSYASMLDMFHKNYDKSDDLESRLNSDNLEKNRKNLIYIILIILMILSVIIIVIFKINPNIISDKILLIYFTGILILLFFINYYFKV
tara:strand:+ start:2872 stop:4056 length:1185 start_codon:yes stop_codon:yes gene_type:complete